MTFYEYQQEAIKTKFYPTEFGAYSAILGLNGNAGSLASRLNKIITSQGGAFKDSDLFNIKNDLGDLLWYISAIANELKMSLDEIAISNISRITQPIPETSQEDTNQETTENNETREDK